MSSQSLVQNGVGNAVVGVGALTAHPRNYNQHSAGQVGDLRRSLRRFGQVRSIVVQAQADGERYLIVAGHGIVTAARAEGIESLRADVIPADWDDAMVLAYLAADNELARQGEPDEAQLAALLRDVAATADRELAALAAGSEARLTEMLATLGEGADGDAEPQVDRAAELQEKWQVAPGDVWRIGDHRLACGDCTDPAVVERVMGGEKAEMLFEDPPYGIDRDEGFGGFGGFGPPIARRQYQDDWDSQRPSRETFDLHLSQAVSAVIFGGNFFADILPQSTHWVVWDKLNTMPTFGDCELAWTNVRRKSVKKITVQYNGLIGKEKERFHPTQKPVGLYVEILQEYSTDKAIIADFYLGSGTTLIACENLGRKCRAVEIAPGYVAVALERMATAFPGIEIERLLPRAKMDLVSDD